MKSDEKEKIIKAAINMIDELIKNGYTNYKIAKETSITETTIGNYINKKTNPSFANAKIILHHYGDNASNRDINVSGKENIGVGNNTGIIHKGNKVNIADPAAKKIIEGERIEIQREIYAEEKLLQENNRLLTKIEGLESTLKAKDDIIAAKDRTIDALQHTIDILSKNKE